ncbi:SMEK domain-containing protein [Aeromonas salmonicida]|uniref:SMEK domain-containing protein n=1 Tax=Aeromonas salmonicida TaxID=645 RepID=UPI00279661CE|nr:SMEK domain-containing protein [Aeromonas salmonicida]MDQ1886664.1 SMEK domain-containing protein [Aeromonas salmonicida]
MLFFQLLKVAQSMTRQELLHRSSTLLGRFAHEVQVANAMGLFDINTVAEDFLIPIFAVAFNCPNLCNQNRIRMNFPAVDLGCETSKVSIQITSDSSTNKMCETLEKFESHGLGGKFDSLYIYVITEKKKSYSSQKLTMAVRNISINFTPSDDILDFEDLVKVISGLTNDQLKEINEHLENEFGQADAKFKFRNNLDDFLMVSQQKIEDEKQTKKYIPSVFIETSGTKDEIRYFANPLFFFRKIDDDIKRINLVKFNDLLDKAKVAPIVDNIIEMTALDLPSNQQELKERLVKQHTALEVIQENLSPFSWYSDNAKQFEPNDRLMGYWEVFRYNIRSIGSELFRSIEDISKKIKITQAKIFLVTGMAGQGKTNFICDLIENQFRAFTIPAIFIPARSLNDYPSPNRILSYINNNRYAPDAKNIHVLFSFLNNVAEECQKPFIIAIDGINEVGDLDGFAAELRVFLDALCQYDFVKIVLTCRNEFFDHKFSDVFNYQLSEHMYRVQNLQNEMSEENKARLLEAYFYHFKIKGKLSDAATKFLENDLILLRIFSEINEDKNIGFVPDIYKGNIFEQYLMKTIEKFPARSRQKVLKTLYQICARMLINESFTQISVENFDESERQIIEQLIGEDIILRREVPPTGLMSIGVENISFTYDELRDFLLAYYTVAELSIHQSELNELFSKISKWSIYEGFFRYAYVLARKQKNSPVLAVCESSDDFQRHYINNLSLLSADIQTPEDVDKIKIVLKDTTKPRNLKDVAWFLFKKREESEHLNIRVLLEHLDGLDDTESEQFMKAMFSHAGSGGWRDKITHLLNSLTDYDEEQRLNLGVPTLALTLYFAPHAHWSGRETILNFFGQCKHKAEIVDALEMCKNAASSEVRFCLKEIEEE